MHRNWLDQEIEHLGVSEEISPDDEMLVDESVPGAREHYFIVGRSVLRCMEVTMLSAGKAGAGRILDFQQADMGRSPGRCWLCPAPDRERPATA